MKKKFHLDDLLENQLVRELKHAMKILEVLIAFSNVFFFSFNDYAAGGLNNFSPK